MTKEIDRMILTIEKFRESSRKADLTLSMSRIEFDKLFKYIYGYSSSVSEIEVSGVRIKKA